MHIDIDHCSKENLNFKFAIFEFYKFSTFVCTNMFYSNLENCPFVDEAIFV